MENKMSSEKKAFLMVNSVRCQDALQLRKTREQGGCKKIFDVQGVENRKN